MLNTRIKFSQLLLATICLLLISPSGVWAQDAVFRLKSARGSSKVNGKITKISPSGVTIDGKEVKASEIRRLSFSKEPSEVNRAREQMRSGRYADSIEELNKIEGTVRNKKLLGEIEFIKAYATSQISLRGGSIPAQKAGQTVRAFITAYPDSVHLYPAIEQFGKLLFAFGKPDLAIKEFDKIANSDWLEYRLKGQYYKGQMMFQMNNPAGAEAAFDAILGVQENDDISQTYKLLAKVGKAKAQGLQGNLDAAKQALETLIAEENAENKQLFASLYNALGDVHQKAGKLKEASWDYLHTELLYSSEREAHAEALFKLAKLWPKLEDTDRANRARDTLKNRYRNSFWAGKL